jgi:hypothetical protein
MAVPCGVGAKQIPAISFDVENDSGSAAALDARPRNKTDASIHHSLVCWLEVFDPRGKAHTAGELLPDPRNLVFAIGAGKEDASLGSARPDDKPPFRTDIFRHRRCVLDQLELGGVDEESKSGFVVPHNRCDQFKTRHTSS